MYRLEQFVRKFESFKKNLVFHPESSLVLFTTLNSPLWPDIMYVKIACVAGLLISIYALWIEVQVYTHSNYLALCDLHQYISCSRVLTSR